MAGFALWAREPHPPSPAAQPSRLHEVPARPSHASGATESSAAAATRGIRWGSVCRAAGITPGRERANQEALGSLPARANQEFLASIENTQRSAPPDRNWSALAWDALMIADDEDTVGVEEAINEVSQLREPLLQWVADLGSDGTACSICLGHDPAGAVELGCGYRHRFHLSCIAAWCAAGGSTPLSCPLCRELLAP